jgi:hypothetical protein
VIHSAAAPSCGAAPPPPSLVRGTLTRCNQQAAVDSRYDSQRFTIRYVRSANLSYDRTNIASDHNTYVQRLHRAIATQGRA